MPDREDLLRAARSALSPVPHDEEVARAMRALVSKVVELDDRVATQPAIKYATCTAVDHDAHTISVEVPILDADGEPDVQTISTVQVLGQSLPPVDAPVVLVDHGRGRLVCLGSIGTSLEYVEFTPDFTGLTLGTGGVLYGELWRLGRRVEYRAGFKLGTSGDVTAVLDMTGPFDLALPPGGSGAANLWSGSAVGIDQDASRRYSSTCYRTSLESDLWVSRIADDDASTGWSASDPFNWTTNDQLSIWGVVHAA